MNIPVRVTLLVSASIGPLSVNMIRGHLTLILCFLGFSMGIAKVLTPGFSLDLKPKKY